MSRSTYLGQSELAILRDWAQALNVLFHGERSYVVGSALERPDWRDVDVRHIMDDDKFAVLASVIDVRRLNLAVSLWGQKVTGLPIDFQIQPRASSSEYDGRRDPLGTWPTDAEMPQ